MKTDVGYFKAGSVNLIIAIQKSLMKGCTQKFLKGVSQMTYF